MSKTIKIIQLLNKIANGEEVPKKIKKKHLEGNSFEDLIDNLKYFDKDFSKTLNDEVEIIEEQEEINIQDIENVNLFDNGQNFNDMPIIIKSYDDNFTNINNTINQLVQAVKQLDKNIKEK